MSKPAVFKYDLGWKAKDKVTGFIGIIVYRVEHITGCPVYGLEPGLDKDNKMQEKQSFDENRIEIIGNEPVVDLLPAPVAEVEVSTSGYKGGPHDPIKESRTL